MSMFGTPKPTASLSSGLLARKGHARPAMRSQGYVGLTPTHAQDDLGWNDMGEEAAPQPPAPVAAVPDSAPITAPPPSVLRQRAAIEESFAPEAPAEAPAPAPKPVAERPAPAAPAAQRPAPAPKPAETTATIAPATLARVAREVKAQKAKAAFTLRLDPDRHLRLRLASAVRHQSAQHLVTEALDAFLESLTDVDALAQVVAREGRD